MRALPLVERGRASGAVLLAVLAAEPRRAGHVVVGHRGRLHRLQGFVGRVAPAHTHTQRNDESKPFFFGVTHKHGSLTRACRARTWGGSVASALAGWSWIAFRP